MPVQLVHQRNLHIVSLRNLYKIKQEALQLETMLHTLYSRGQSQATIVPSLGHHSRSESSIVSTANVPMISHEWQARRFT